MILSDRDIRAAIKAKRIVVKPTPDFTTQLGSNSLDLRLGNTFRIFDHSKYAFIDPFQKKIGEEITREVKKGPKESFIIQPGDFVLGTTVEYVELPDDLVGSLEGRSSLGRLGIIVHSTAASIECGFQGKITLELANMGKMPVALYPGMRICALSFMQMTSPADVPYYKKKGAKYVGQMDPEESKFDQEK
ncbi:MAG TPA: dCTP deaminase [Patescibacteria group bacterium]|nr:dCTP deaminase [Patescibacteria group bacterium]